MSLSHPTGKTAGSSDEEIANRNFSGETPLLGVYFGWRGNVTNLPLVNRLPCYDRRNAAIRTPVHT